MYNYCDLAQEFFLDFRVRQPSRDPAEEWSCTGRFFAITFGKPQMQMLKVPRHGVKVRVDVEV